MIALFAALALAAARPAPPVSAPPDAVCADCIRQHVERLASPDLHGRRCGTADERAAATYLEGELRAAGVSGAWPGGGYRQSVPLETPRFSAPPSLVIAGGPTLAVGERLAVLGAPHELSGPFLRVTDAAAPPAAVKGAVVLLDPAAPGGPGARALTKAGAALVIEVLPAQAAAHWADIVASGGRVRLRGSAGTPGPLRAYVRAEDAETLRATRPGAVARLVATPAAPETAEAVNLVGVVHGSAPDADRTALLLSAHYDHLGERGGRLYPGANDDASGTAAVLEFARLLAHGAPPRRTVYFALFSCEEAGELGSDWFRGHPVTPVANLAANLEFEMIGFPDPKRPDTLMMTGFERSDLGPALQAHGARVGPDLYPEGNFFERSDNFQLARQGVVAHTLSGWPTPPTYHQPTDDPAHVDFGFMAATVGSLVAPVRWLADGGFTPSWKPGGRP